jgi:hypothetical protein
MRDRPEIIDLLIVARRLLRACHLSSALMA